MSCTGNGCTVPEAHVPFDHRVSGNRILVGPHAFAVINSTHDVEKMAEIGVVLLNSSRNKSRVKATKKDLSN